MPEETPSRVIGSVVCLPVRDLEASAVFYQRVFDLSDLVAEEGMITLELPGLSLFLLEESEFESYSEKVGRRVSYPGPGTGVILSCAIASEGTLKSMLDEVTANGGTVPASAGADEGMGLYLGYFFDPDGHHWELAHSNRG